MTITQPQSSSVNIGFSAFVIYGKRQVALRCLPIQRNKILLYLGFIGSLSLIKIGMLNSRFPLFTTECLKAARSELPSPALALELHVIEIVCPCVLSHGFFTALSFGRKRSSFFNLEPQKFFSCRHSASKVCTVYTKHLVHMMLPVTFHYLLIPFVCRQSKTKRSELLELGYFTARQRYR